MQNQPETSTVPLEFLAFSSYRTVENHFKPHLPQGRELWIVQLRPPGWPSWPSPAAAVGLEAAGLTWCCEWTPSGCSSYQAWILLVTPSFGPFFVSYVHRIRWEVFRCFTESKTHFLGHSPNWLFWWSSSKQETRLAWNDFLLENSQCFSRDHHFLPKCLTPFLGLPGNWSKSALLEFLGPILFYFLFFFCIEV